MSNLRLPGMRNGAYFGPGLQYECERVPGRGLRFDPEWRLLPLSESIGLGAAEGVKTKKGKDTTFPFVRLQYRGGN
jgi:hypothetical protein